MIIKRMCATFGTLEQATLELQDGLNIIEAPNETGKSTWAAFLRTMLYGLNTRERDRKNSIAEKNLFQPWSGAPMEGSLDLIWQGREITLRRFRKGVVPFGGFEAVYTGTGTPVPDITGENAGELLLGVGREIYERSAFVGQSALVIDQTAELECRILALVSSGQEDVSFSQTQKRLKEWQNRRKYNKSGLIPQLDQELSSIERTLQKVDDALSQTAADRADLERLQRQETELKQELSIHKKRSNQEAWRRLQTVKAEFDQKQETFLATEAEAKRYGTAPDASVLRSGQEALNYLSTLDSNLRLARRQQTEAEDAVSKAQEARCDNSFTNCTADEAWSQASSDAEKITNETQLANKFPPTAFAVLILGFLLGAGCCAAALLFPVAQLILIVLGIALFILSAILSFPIKSKWKQQHDTAVRAVYSKYPSAVSTEDVLRQAAAYRETYSALLNAKEQLSRLTQALDDMEQERTQLIQSLLELVHPFAPEVNEVFGISAALSRALTLDDRCKTAEREYKSALRMWETISASGMPEPPVAEFYAPPLRTPEETETMLISVTAEITRLQRTLDLTAGELRSLGDPAGLRAQKAQLSEQLSARNQEHQAISLAMDALQSAHNRLEERFSPVLNQKTGEILSAFTDGKYTSVTLNRDLDATASAAGEILPHRVLTLSIGTIDQLYLALRLAVCDITLPATETAPLVLDDALTFFDDRRMGLALSYLAKQPRQILLFSCHHREAAFFENTPEVTIISLQSTMN
jgi:uncharacterized protein YhaN